MAHKTFLEICFILSLKIKQNLLLWKELKKGKMKKVAILQSNYIPWKGYFDIINMVDVFIFHDDLQYTKGDWRNRNKIKTPNGTEWLTIPCGSSEKRLINEVVLSDHSWQKKHWTKIENNYRKAKYFKEYVDFFKNIYLSKKWLYLSELNQFIIKTIAYDIFRINTKFESSLAYNLKLSKSERVLELLKKSGANCYVSGPSAKSYLDIKSFDEANINIIWVDYSNYPIYNQLFEPFEHNVSILDLIFNEGPNATKFMKSFVKNNTHCQ